MILHRSSDGVLRKPAGIAIIAILAGFVMFLLAPTASASAVSSHSWPNHVIGGAVGRTLTQHSASRATAPLPL